MAPHRPDREPFGVRRVTPFRLRHGGCDPKELFHAGQGGTLATLTSKVSLPVNVTAGPGAPDVATLRAAGVRRVSVGQAIAQAAYTVARKAAAEALTAGTYDSIAGADSFGDVNGTFPAREVSYWKAESSA